MRNSFVFYGSWWEAIKNLPRDVQGDVLTAIIEYGLYGETTEQLKPIAKAMLAMVKAQIDVNNQRFENGKKGGRKKVNDNQNKTKQKPKSNQTETKDEPNVYVNDNVNESPNGDKESAILSEILEKSLEDCYEELSTNSSWIEAVVMNKRSAGHQNLTLESFQEYLKRFFDKLRNEGEIRKSPKDGMAHFARWLDIELGKSKSDMYRIENERLLSSAKENNKGYYQFLLYIKKQAPYCFSNMRLPTEEEALLLRDKYGNEMFKKALRTLEGRTDIRSKWDVLYYAVLKQIDYQNGS